MMVAQLRCCDAAILRCSARKILEERLISNGYQVQQSVLTVAYGGCILIDTAAFDPQVHTNGTKSRLNVDRAKLDSFIAFNCVGSTPYLEMISFSSTFKRSH